MVGGEKVFFHTSPIFKDGVVYAPLVALNAVGAKYKTDDKRKRDGQKVEITSAGGQKLTSRARLVEKELLLPILEIAPELGAVTDWDESSKTLRLRARIEDIAFDGSELRVRTSYPVTYDSVWWKGAKKLILDMHGIHMPSKQSELRIDNSTSVPIRTGIQKDGETGRIVLDMPNDVAHSVKSAPKTSAVVISVSGLKVKPSDPTVAPDVQVTEREPGSSGITAETPLPEPISVTDIDYGKQGSRRIEVRVSLSGPAKYRTSILRDPDRFVLDIADAVLAQKIEDIPVGHDLLQGIRVGQPAKNTVRLTMDLVRVTAYDVQHDNSSNRLVISFELPRGAGGLLADKIVVIDPGHGGKFPGTPGNGGKPEKYHTLDIAKRLKTLLIGAGATAPMTRDSDVELDSDLRTDLWKRVSFAERHSADFLISIHCNSCQVPGSISGTQTFYHRGDTTGRALAEAIHFEVVKVSGLPDLKVRPDPGAGFVVLRGPSANGIPAILIEVGFLNHPHDAAKICSPAFQQKIAEAVVRGLKTYVEGNPQRTIRRAEATEPEVEQVQSRPGNESNPGAESAPEHRVESNAPVPHAGGLQDTVPTKGPRRPGER